MPYGKGIVSLLSFTLRKQLRHFTVDITHTVGAETLVLIGHSGCGKSTVLQMLAGLVTPDQGSVELDGRLIFDGQQGVDVPPESRKIGYVFQNYALFPHLTVSENIAYGLSRLSEEEKEVRIGEALSLLGLQSLANAKPAMLSGGEQQRVALARAIVTRPQLLLLDEPLSALDISTRSRVRSELKELLRTLAIPTIVVTHDYDDARVLGDRIAVMDRGMIIQSGRPQEISQYPVNDFVAEFTGTNLLPVPAGDRKEEAYVAFDSWRVQVSSSPKGSEYEWNGQIRDINWIGGIVRLHIEGPSLFLADAPVEQMEREAFSVGDTVYVSVVPEDVRMLPSAPAIVRIRPRNSSEVVVSSERASKTKGRKRKWAVAIVAALAVTSLVTGFGMSSKNTGQSDLKEMTAFIAANATDPSNDLIKLFEERQKGVKVEAAFAGTQVIRTQLEHGAKADFFLSADLSHIEALKQEGLIDQYYPVSNNHEVIVVSKSDPSGVNSLPDLAEKPVKLVIGTDTVPIGKYTRQVFEKADADYGTQFSKNVMAHVVSLETNVKQVLQKVAMGEADAGIVYRSDVTSSFSDKVQIIEIPEKYNVKATNYIAIPKNAPFPDLGNQFMQLMLSPEGQAVFAKYNYDPID